MNAADASGCRGAGTRRKAADLDHMPDFVGSATVVEGTRYTIDELARATGTTARTIRSYQDRGLLPPPVIVGRTGQYDDDHAVRLRVIARLLDERFSLASIGALLHAWETGESLAHILGFVDDLDRDRDVDRDRDLDRAARRHPSGGAALTHRVATAELVAAGVPVDVVLAEIAHLQADCERIVARFVTMVETHVAATATADAPRSAHRSHELAAALPGEVRSLLEDALATRASAAGGAGPRPGGGTDDRTNEIALGAIDLTGNAVLADLTPDGRLAAPHGADPAPRQRP